MSWKKSRMKLMRSLEFTRKEWRHLMMKTLLEKILNLPKKFFCTNYWRLHLFLGKLISNWTSPFIVKTIYPHIAIGIQNLINGNIFEVNEHCLKPFLRTSRNWKSLLLSMILKIDFVFPLFCLYAIFIMVCLS